MRRTGWGGSSKCINLGDKVIKNFFLRERGEFKCLVRGREQFKSTMGISFVVRKSFNVLSLAKFVCIATQYDRKRAVVSRLRD